MKTLKEIDAILSAAMDAVEELDHRNEAFGNAQMKFHRYGEDLQTAIRTCPREFLNPTDAPKPPVASLPAKF